MDEIVHFWTCQNECSAFKTIGKPNVCPFCESPYLRPVRDANLREFEEFENAGQPTEFGEK